jgi:hypothetical protein
MPEKNTAFREFLLLIDLGALPFQTARRKLLQLRYLKDILFYALIFYLTPLKNYQRFWKLFYYYFFTVHWDKSIL